MRVVVLVTREGFTKNIYDQLMRELNVEDNPPKGMVTHIATFDNKGIRVTDIWESEQDFRNFSEKRLMPGLNKVGFREKPTIEIYPLALYLTEEKLHKHAGVH